MNDFLDSRMKAFCVLALSTFSFFMIMSALSSMAEVGLKRKAAIATNVITVRGSAKAAAMPDVATFTFTVREEAKDVKDAQQKMAEKSNAAIAALRKKEVLEKNIKTQNYSTNPKYNYAVCKTAYCPPQNPVLAGYEATQTISVKITEIAKAGEILNDISAIGVGEISGLTFALDEPEKLKAQVRAEAIDKAKKDAKILAKSLGVRLGNVVRFNEDNAGIYPMESRLMMVAKSSMDGLSEIPQIQSGEQQISANVTITYEIK